MLYLFLFTVFPNCTNVQLGDDWVAVDYQTDSKKHIELTRERYDIYFAQFEMLADAP